MKKILILCTGNSCRSQMAQGYLARFLVNKAEVYSAGVEAHGLNPRAVQVMAEDGIDISHHRSDPVTKYLHLLPDVILTVCDHARENCPYIPGRAMRFHQSFPDPARAAGNEEEIMAQFRQTRDLIREYCSWLAGEIAPG